MRDFWGYGLLMVSLFFFGLLFPNYAWAAFLAVPLASSYLYGYNTKEVKKALRVIIQGILLFGVAAAILGFLLVSHTHSWEYLNNMSYFSLSITTYDVALSYLAVMIVGFASLQVPLQVFGTLIGVYISSLRESPLPTEERLTTSGEFTRESVAKNGASKVRVIGVVPVDLVEWMNEKISKGDYTNQSHIMEAALRAFKEREERA